MIQSEVRLVYITAGDPEEAGSIGRALLEARLVACINIFSPMKSLYWWDGVIEESTETAIVAKTLASNTDALVEMVKKRHSYDCPCVVVLPIEDGNPAFLRWIENEAEVRK